MTISTNLKMYKNLEPNKDTYYTNFNNEKSKLNQKAFMNNYSFFQLKNNSTDSIDYMQIFSEIGDKTFICVILLYFSSCGYYLFISTLIMKLLHENTKHFFLSDNFMLDNYLFKIIFPFKIFQFIGVIFYQLCGYSLLFKMVFRNSGTAKNPDLENQEDKFNSQEKLRMIFIILFSFFSSFNIDESAMAVPYSFTVNKFVLNIVQVVISLIFAFCIGQFFQKRVSKDATQIFSSITFILISVDGTIKLFSY